MKPRDIINAIELSLSRKQKDGINVADLDVKRIDFLEDGKMLWETID